MKRCPTCTRVYDGDQLRFCLDDGSPLVDKPSENAAPETLVLPSAEKNQPTMEAAQPPPPLSDHIPPTVASASRPRRNLIVWIVVIALGVPLLGGVGLGAWTMFRKKPLAWHLVLQVILRRRLAQMPFNRLSHNRKAPRRSGCPQLRG